MLSRINPAIINKAVIYHETQLESVNETINGHSSAIISHDSEISFINETIDDHELRITTHDTDINNNINDSQTITIHTIIFGIPLIKTIYRIINDKHFRESCAH